MLAILFVAIAAVLCVAAALALVGIGYVRLSEPDAIQRDGLARGRRSPAWRLASLAGQVHASPPLRPLQLVLFGDHSLRSFPSLAAGLRGLAGDEDLEIVIMTRGPAGPTGPVLAELGLAAIPVVEGSPALYARYNVRVMPFAIFVDSAGRVRASSLVNHDWQLAKLRLVAGLPLAQGDLPMRRRRPAMAG
jgi:hypothetical protein